MVISISKAQINTCTQNTAITATAATVLTGICAIAFNTSCESTYYPSLNCVISVAEIFMGLYMGSSYLSVASLTMWHLTRTTAENKDNQSKHWAKWIALGAGIGICALWSAGAYFLLKDDHRGRWPGLGTMMFLTSFAIPAAGLSLTHLGRD